jgi:sec-independent protein translocase protein TatC
MATQDDLSLPEDVGAAENGPGVRLPGKRNNPDGSMPLMEHIRELRNRVFRIVAFIAAGSIVGWLVYGRVWSFVQAPYCRLPQPKGAFALATGHHGETCTLYVNGLFDAFFLHIQIAIITGVIISSPLWLYQLWAFIAPGLYKRERRWAYFFGGSAVPLFLIGGTLAYFAMTKGLRFLLGQVPKGVFPLITIDTYIGYALTMLLIFGIAFELPLVFVLLNLARVLTHERFAKWRRMIIFGVFVFAAVATPSPDPISMLLLAVPCVALVELAEVFAFFNDRHRARVMANNPYPGLSQEEIAEFRLDSGPGSELEGGSDQED